MSLAIRVLLPLFLAAPLVPALPAHAQTTETAAVITELKPGRGRVEVKPAAGGGWKPARPPLAPPARGAGRPPDHPGAARLPPARRGPGRVGGAGGTVTAAGPPGPGA